jgi:hypothetical protein
MLHLRRTMSNREISKEQLIRVKIIPQLESLSDNLFDNDSVSNRYARRLDRITEELITLLNND